MGKNKQKIYFRADASASIGYGHFIRALALADMLVQDFDCTFYTLSITEYQKREIEKVCKYVELKSENPFDEFLECLYGNEIVVLDNYFYDSSYQKKIKYKGSKLVCIDDMHDKHYYADVVINHALTNPSLFSIEPYTKLALGFDYALLRKPFLTKIDDSKKEKGHWFVSFGGADFNNITAKFVNYLDIAQNVKSITVVIGDAYKYLDTITSFKKVEIKKNLTAAQMQYEMSRAEYALVPTSSVSIEAMSCRCKIISGYFVENQRECYCLFMKNNWIYPLGDLNNYQDGIFINEIEKFKCNYDFDFSKVPNRYIDLISSISYDL